VNPGDARRSIRPLIRMSLRFRCVEPVAETAEYPAETLNVSTHGFLMKSTKRLPVGSFLHLKLQVPTGVSGSAFSQIQGTGRVVHEQRLKDGSIGYGIEIKHTVPRPRRQR